MKIIKVNLARLSFRRYQERYLGENSNLKHGWGNEVVFKGDFEYIS